VLTLIDTMKRIRFIALLVMVLAAQHAAAQRKDSSAPRLLSVDSIAARKVMLNDSLRKKHSPRKATIRSAILPGWGQIYNGKYWKLPLVYGALGITGSVFVYNLNQYRNVRFAYITLRDTVFADYPKVKPELQPFITAGDLNSLRNYRDEFRKNIDYSVLFFLFFWGINVVDATVDAHLKEFDVSRDLGFKVKPSINSLPIAGMPLSMGLSVVVTLR
jgi:hypothetical protein